MKPLQRTAAAAALALALIFGLSACGGGDWPACEVADAPAPDKKAIPAEPCDDAAF